MATVVVGGSGRNAGKTALVCGLIAALPEFAWIAVKITNHPHGDLPPVYEEAAAGQGTDTGRYMAAGARRGFLITADDSELGERLDELWSVAGRDSNVIFESNRVLNWIQPDLCLAIEADPTGLRKPSFQLVEHQKLITVRRTQSDSEARIVESPGAQPAFYLRNFEHISPTVQQWLREHLRAQTRG